jgi:hypothetical protein
MDDDSKEMVTTLIPALTICPQNATEYLGQLVSSTQTEKAFWGFSSG